MNRVIAVLKPADLLLPGWYRFPNRLKARDSLQYHRVGVLLLCLQVLALTGCSGASSTRDLSGTDSRTLVGSVSAVHSITEVRGVEFNAQITAGTTQHNAGEIGVQVDGTRYSDPASFENKYQLRAVSGNYRFRVLNKQYFKLVLAPGLALSGYQLDAAVNDSGTDAELSLSDLRFGAGLKIEARVPVTRRVELQGLWAAYDQQDSQLFEEVGVGFIIKPNDRYHWYLGYKVLSLGDGTHTNGDTCGRTDGECLESGVEIESGGATLGLQVNL